MRGGEQTVYIADADERLRALLTNTLRAQGLTTRAYASGIQLLSHLDETRRGCVIADLRAMDFDGFSLLKALQDRRCALPAILMAANADIPLAVRAIKAGAAEFLEKPLQPARVLAVVRECLQSAQAIGERSSHRRVVLERKRGLTGRELQVLAAVVEGRSGKEIGLSLGISPRTVEIHRARVMRKMRAEGLPELIRMVVSADLAA